jgi:four helix bundle protein
MSITNNIAEGSGSYSNADFSRFLNYSRRSVFECANIIAIMLLKKYILEEKKISLFDKLDHLSSMITNFQKRLLQ